MEQEYVAWDVNDVGGGAKWTKGVKENEKNEEKTLGETARWRTLLGCWILETGGSYSLSFEGRSKNLPPTPIPEGGRDQCPRRRERTDL